jgi:hypothetical protein
MHPFHVMQARHHVRPLPLSCKYINTCVPSHCHANISTHAFPPIVMQIYQHMRSLPLSCKYINISHQNKRAKVVSTVSHVLCHGWHSRT